ncbi:hypothetical protein [Xenorhabdus khoisanae]|uniref:hypothetical protein n=1 Tax=Xenorhabdus khoisanae TaxID=880157 RepID=UPI003D6EAE56
MLALALVLLLDGAGVVAVRNKHQTAVQYLHGQGTALIRHSPGGNAASQRHR